MARKKTSNFSWKTQLARKLKQTADRTNQKVAILGIGNELNGDDSAGLWVVRKLRDRLGDKPNLLLMDCGAVPETATGPLRKFEPGLVLMVDAADMGEEPGTIKIIEIDDVRGFSASSHSLPLSVLAGFIQTEFDCEVCLCCFQPQSLDFDQGLTSLVEKAVERLVREVSISV